MADLFGELKPCPFCGDTATTFFCGSYWSVLCNACEGEGPPSDHEGGAITYWNNRAAGGVTPAEAPRCKQCGVAPGSVVQVGWICKDDLARLLQTGEAEIYEERQEFSLLPEQEQFAVYVRKGANGVAAVAPTVTDEDVKQACYAASLLITDESMKDMRRALEGFMKARSAGVPGTVEGQQK